MSQFDAEAMLAARRRRERALALAREEQAEAPRRRRNTLSSMSDEEEDSKVTAALVEGAVSGALKATANGRHEFHPGSVEIDTPAGFRIRGAVWALVVVSVVIAALVAALRLVHPH
jgi:hypothetical protein